MDKNSYIGVFDSGVGGLTVAKGIMDRLPNENIIYFGDTAHVPYGTRSKRQITRYVLDDVAFLRQYDIKAVVIACNTADSTAREKVEETYPDLPVFGVVHPASEQAARATKNNKIGVIATKATANSQAYDKAIAEINPEATVIDVGCPLLVPLVENGRFQKGDLIPETVVREYLDPLVAQGIDTLILGCTHYPLLTDIIAEAYPQLTIISSSDAAARALREGLQKTDMLSDTPGGEHKYFVSDDAALVEGIAHYFMGKELDGKVEQISVG